MLFLSWRISRNTLMNDAARLGKLPSRARPPSLQWEG
jgi:hypothetical protein